MNNNPRCEHGVGWLDACELCDTTRRAETLSILLRGMALRVAYWRDQAKQARDELQVARDLATSRGYEAPLPERFAYLSSDDDEPAQRVTLDDVAGILGPDWTGGLDAAEWVRRQRDDD